VVSSGGARPTIVSERRIITMLAVDIVGSMRHIADCDPDDAQSFFDRCFKHIREAIEPSGGSLVSFEGDGGIAAFGWPVAYEDHTDRACEAAWNLQNRDAGLGPNGAPVRFRAGIHSGLVALRKVRRGRRSHLDTVGATVHIAAKLQQSAAPGGILLTAEAARLCRSALKLAPRKVPRVLQGVTAGVFALESRPADRRSDDVLHRYGGAMIGRQPERTRLRRALPRPGGRGSAVAIIGEPGVGKSRLAAALVEDAVALDVRILVFFGDAQKRTTPFAIARDLLAEALGSTGRSCPEASRTALARAGLTDWEIDAIQSAIAAPGDARRGTGPRPTERQLARLFAEAFRVLRLDRPTLLLIEDLHLVDAESRKFLEALAGVTERDPFCLLLTSRPESRDAAEKVAPRSVGLEPLPRSAMKAIGRQLWQASRAVPPVLDALVERAEGIPFVLEELIYAANGRDAGQANALPQGVGSLIHARLQQLSPEAKTLAQTLSLLGGSVEIELAGDVLGRTAEPLLEELAELERFAFVHPVAGRPIRMRHQILSEACAETITHSRRKDLHRAALRAIRARYPERAGHYEQLAFHAEGAGDVAEAVDYLWEAAHEARRNSAAVSLSLIFDRAVALIETLGAAGEARYINFVLMAFASLVQLGEFEKVNAHLPRVMEAARRSGKPALICSTLSQLGMICWFEGRYEEGLRATEEGLTIARSLKSPALIFSNQFMLANNLHGMGAVARAIAVGRELCEMLSGELETARLGAAGIPRATMLSFMSWFMMDAGAYEEGLDYAQEGLAVALRAQDPYSEVLARHGLAHNLLMLDRNSEAVDCLATAREISERNGYDAIKANLVGRMAIALSRAGRAAEAIAMVEDCLRKRLHLRTGQLERYYLRAGYAEALVRSGAVARGLTVLADALEIARGICNPCLVVNALGLRAWFLTELRPGDAQIGRDLAERATLCAAHGLVAWPRLPASGWAFRIRSNRAARPMVT
jgi:class 3 adenylate cyclase/tetratricopeptide (TPR) repeat protein